MFAMRIWPKSILRTSSLMQKSLKFALLIAMAIFVYLDAQLVSAESAQDVCPRPTVGSIVEEPQDLRSQNGVLEENLTIHNEANPDGSLRFCYRDASGRESPNLRVSPGDLVILHLRDALTDLSPGSAPPAHVHPA